MEETNWWLFFGATLSGLAVLLGAFGAHGLEGRVTPERLETFEIGVRYQMYHGLALLLLALLKTSIDHSLMKYVGIGFIVGVVIFSGSLYLLVTTDTPWLGAITPIGGVAMVASWILLAYIAITEGNV